MSNETAFESRYWNGVDRKLDRIEDSIKELRDALAKYDKRVDLIDQRVAALEKAEAARASLSSQVKHDWRRAAIDLVKQLAVWAAGCFVAGWLLQK